MELVADIDRECSFDAMWCVYLTSDSVAENLSKNRTSVVRAFLNARYYNSAQGQFLSEDPVFLDDLKNQNLTNSQGLNSYSYADNKPITKSNPTGRCPLCLLALGGAGAGMAGQFGYDVYNNVQAGGWQNAFSNFSSSDVYLTRAMQGAVIGATGGAAGAFTASIAGQAAIVGGASGIVGAGGNAYLGDPTTMQSVAADTIIGGLSFGLGKFVPGVPGRLPNFGTDAFFFGKHTQESAMRLGVDSISNYTSQLLGGFSFGSSYQSRSTAVQSYNTSSGATTPHSQLWVTPSGAVVNWGGQCS